MIKIMESEEFPFECHWHIQTSSMAHVRSPYDSTTILLVSMINNNFAITLLRKFSIALANGRLFDCDVCLQFSRYTGSDNVRQKQTQLNGTISILLNNLHSLRQFVCFRCFFVLDILMRRKWSVECNGTARIDRRCQANVEYVCAAPGTP